jgi:6-phosphogluconolactonase (cycloisomerase 2 family)
MKPSWSKIAAVGLATAMLAAGVIHAARRAGAAAPATGFVYTLSNDGERNGVVALARNADGALTEVAGSPFATSGKGLVVPPGGDFDAQGSLRIHGNYLLAVNPGSNSIAVFTIGAGGGLTTVSGSPFPSGGVTPLSLSAHGDLLYVANQAIPFMTPERPPNITGFRMRPDGGLTPIPGSTIEFPAGQGPAQVEFSPSGSVLAVTAGFQSDGRIHTFAVQPDGRLREGPGSPFIARDVSGTVGYSWSRDGRYLLVSNFRGSAMTVFSVDGTTAAISPKGAPYPNGGGAACWTALSPDGHTLYTGNFVGNSISAYAMNADGTLELLGTVARRTATRPDTKDIAVSPDGKYLYAIGPVARHVAAFAIGPDGLPKELAVQQSPYSVTSGQWTTGLVVN